MNKTLLLIAISYVGSTLDALGALISRSHTSESTPVILECIITIYTYTYPLTFLFLVRIVVLFNVKGK